MSDGEDEELQYLSRQTYARRQVPVRDALVMWVPEGEEGDPGVAQAQGRTGFSRWFPVQGGHRLLVPYDGGPYDAARLKIEPGGWDHETCQLCRAHIDPMTPCWVTTTEEYVDLVLCDACHTQARQENDAERA